MKHRLIPALFLMAALCVAAACDDNLPVVINDNTFTLESDSPYFSGDFIDFPATGGSATVRVLTQASSVAWRIKTTLDDTWCAYETTENSFKLTTAANNSGYRESSLTVVVGENTRRITVRQDYIPALACETDTVRIKAVGGTFRVPLTTNIVDSKFEVTSDGAWLSALSVTGGALQFTAAENTASAADLTAHVTVSAEGLNVVIVVVQDGTAKEPDPLILPDIYWIPVVTW